MASDTSDPTHDFSHTLRISGHEPYLSDRGKQTIPRIAPLLGHTEPPIYDDLPYPSPFRPGVINLSVAENWVLRPELVEKYKKYLSSEDVNEQSLSYVAGLGGAPELLEGLSNYFNEYFKPVDKVIPKHLVTSPGASHLLDTVFFHLFDAGDGVLISTPYWPGFDLALEVRNKITPVKVNIPFNDPGVYFSPDSVEYYEQAIVYHPKTRGLVICNPQNPLGRCYPRETLEKLFIFAEKHKLQVIVDELYGMSVFEDSDKFVSALSIDLDKIGVEKHRIHVVYSFSKDLCSSGIRLGIFVTQNHPPLRESVAKLQQSKVSTFTSIVGTSLLQDKELPSLIKQNPIRLKENYDLLYSFLNKHKIEFIAPTAGLFAFINFLGSASVHTEGELYAKFYDEGVDLSVGTGFHSTVTGWFRLIIGVKKEMLKEGLLIIQNVLNLKGWSGEEEG